MKSKFIKHYLKLCYTIAEDNTACGSRKLGCVLVDPVRNKILGTGYNGAPRNVPHCGTLDYIDSVFSRISSPTEYKTVRDAVAEKLTENNKSDDSGLCPRRILNIPSGQRMELCATCVHAEVNAIVNAAQDLTGVWMFGNFGVPCYECARVICNTGITNFLGIDSGNDYSVQSRWLLEKAKIDISLFKKEFVL